MLKIKKITTGIWNTNSYQIFNNISSCIIDPGDDFLKLNNEFHTKKIKHKGILCTHGHFDHIGSAFDFQQIYKIPVFIHLDDLKLANQSNLYRNLIGEGKLLNIQLPNFTTFANELKIIKLKDLELRIHHIPGHTNGSVCFEIDNYIFSGDILIEDKIGRTDLPGGNRLKLKNSLNYIFNNFSNYTFLPGHGPEFILDAEKIDMFSNYL
jgi:hydroxyacylglutathione hydrolase